MLPPPDPPREIPLDICLTNNALRWEGCIPRKYDNVDIKGRYLYETPPDGGGDKGRESWIDFSRGALTDRTRVYSRNPTDNYLPQVSVWGNPSPVKIVFDLRKSWKVKRIILYLNGYSPEIRVYGKKDGRWNFLGGRRKEGTLEPYEVKKVEINLKTTPSRFIRIEMGERSKGEKLIISEVEIWR